MTCERFERLLATYVDGDLRPDVADAMRAHSAACATCAGTLDAYRDLFATRRPELGAVGALRGPVPERRPAEHAGDVPDLTRGVLAHTTGPACGAAESLLAAERATATDRALLDAHLATCAPCRALRDVLDWMPDTLAGMRSMEPGPAFTRGVLAATTSEAPGWLERLRTALGRWRARPRFAIEVAYVGTVAIALVFGSPISPWRSVPEQALSLAGSDPTTVVLRSVNRLAWRPLTEVSNALDERRDRMIDAGWNEQIGRLDRNVDGLAEAIWRGDVGATGVQLGKVGGNLQRLWHATSAGITADEEEHDDEQRDE